MQTVVFLDGVPEIATCWARFRDRDENVAVINALVVDVLTVDDDDDESDLTWDMLYHLLAPRVRNWVHRAVSIRGGQELDMAEDILQETLCRVFRYLSKTQQHDIAIAYLERLSIMIAENQLSDLRRKDSRLMHIEGDTNNITELEEEVGTFFLSIMPDLYRYPSIRPDNKGVPTRRSIMKRIRSFLAVIGLEATLSSPFVQVWGSMANAASHHASASFAAGQSTRLGVLKNHLPRYVQGVCDC